MQAHSHKIPTYNSSGGGFIPVGSTNASGYIERDTGTTGGGNSQNLQPYATVNYIIKI